MSEERSKIAWGQMAAATFKPFFPNAVDTVTSTTQFVREMRHATRKLRRGSSGKNGNAGKSWKIFKNAMKDISEGTYDINDISDDLYTGFDEDISMDFDMPTGDDLAGTSSEEIILTGSAGIAKTVIRSQEAQLAGLQKSTRAIVDANVGATRAMTIQLSGELNAGFKGLNLSLTMMNTKLDNIGSYLRSIVEFNNNNTNTFYSNMSTMISSMGKMMDEYDMYTTGQDPNKKSQFKFTKGFNPRQYMKFVAENFNKSLFGSVATVAGVAKEDKGFLGSLIADFLIPDSIKKATKEIDNRVNHMVNEAMNSIHEALSSNFSVAMLGLGDIFGMERKRLKNIGMGSYSKGPMPWNGIAQKALVEVIPELLTSIDAGVNKTEKRYFDYERGQLMTKSQIERAFDSEYLGNLNYALSDSINLLNKYAKKTGKSTSERDGLERAIEAIIDDRLTNAVDAKTARGRISKKMKDFGIDEADYQRFVSLLQANLDEFIDSENERRESIGKSQSVYRNINNTYGDSRVNTLNRRHREHGSGYFGRNYMSGDLVTIIADSQIRLRRTDIDLKNDFRLTKEIRKIVTTKVDPDEQQRAVDAAVKKAYNEKATQRARNRVLGVEESDEFDFDFDEVDPNSRSGRIISRITAMTDRIMRPAHNAIYGRTAYNSTDYDDYEAELVNTTPPPTSRRRKYNVTRGTAAKKAARGNAASARAGRISSTATVEETETGASDDGGGGESSDSDSPSPRRRAVRGARLNNISRQGPSVIKITGDIKIEGANVYINGTNMQGGGGISRMSNNVTAGAGAAPVMTAASSRASKQHVNLGLPSLNTNLDRALGNVERYSFSGFNESMGRSESEVIRDERALIRSTQQIIEDAQEEHPEETAEESTIRTNRTLRGAFGNIVASFMNFGSRMFGKDGFFSKIWDSEKRKEMTGKIKEKLFTGEDAFFKKPWQKIKSGAKYLKDKTGEKLAKGYDYLYDNTMQYMYGSPDMKYNENEKWKDNKFFSRFLNRRERAKWKALRRSAREQARIGQEAAANGGVVSSVNNPSEAISEATENTVSSINRMEEETTEATDHIVSSVHEAADDIADAGRAVADSVEDLGETVVGDVHENPDNKKKSFKKSFFQSLKKVAPKALAAGIVGAGVGLLNSKFSLLGSMFLPQGIVAGAIVGSGLAILSQTEAFKTFLFGKEQMDDQGNMKRTGGLISEGMRKSFLKYLPFAVGGAGVGIMKGIITSGLGFSSNLGIMGVPLLPGGILTGALVGAGIGVLKNSDRFKTMLFGEVGEDGKRHGTFLSKIADGAKGAMFAAAPKLKAGLKGLGIGALSGLVLSKMGYLPAMLSVGGPVGMGLLGLGLGIASTSDRFNTFMFGSEELDADGNPTGRRNKDGLLGRVTNLLRVNMIEPIGDAFKSKMLDLVEWTKDKIEFPFRLAFGPIISSLTTIKDNVEIFIQEKLEALSQGIMDMVRAMVKPILSPITKLVGHIGKSILNMASIGAKLSMAPLSFGLQGLSLLTMGARRENYINFYKNYYSKGNIRGALQARWDASEAAGERVGTLQRVSDTLSAYMGRGEIADIARSAWNQGHSDAGGNALDYMGVPQERRELRERRKERRREEKKWDRINKERSRITNKELHGREVELNDFTVREYRNRFKRLGIDESMLQTSDDIMDLLYRRDKFKAKMNGETEETGTITVTENADQVASREEQVSQLRRQTQLLEALNDQLSQTMYTLATNDVTRRRLRSQNSKYSKAQRRLRMRARAAGVNVDAFSSELYDFDIDNISNEMLLGYRDSQFYEGGRFADFLDSQNVTRRSTYVRGADDNTSNNDEPVSSVNQNTTDDEPETRGERLERVRNTVREHISGFWENSIGRPTQMSNDISTPGVEEERPATAEDIREIIEDAVASTRESLGIIAENTEEQIRVSSADLEYNTGGQVDRNDVRGRNGRSFGARFMQKLSPLTQIFKRKKRQQRADREAAEDAAARALGDADTSNVDDVAGNNTRTLDEPSWLSKFNESKAGKFLKGGLKSMLGIVAIASIVELLSPGAMSGIASKLDAFNTFAQQDGLAEKISEKIVTTVEEKTAAFTNWTATDLAPFIGSVATTIATNTPLILTTVASVIGDSAGAIVDSTVTVLSVLAPPLIEALVLSTPMLVKELMLALGKSAWNLGGDLKDWVLNKVGIGAGRNERNISETRSIQLDNKGINTRSTVHASLGTEEEARAYAEENEIDNPIITYNPRTKKFDVTTEDVLHGDRTAIDENGKEVTTSNNAALVTGAKAGIAYTLDKTKNVFGGKVVKTAQAFKSVAVPTAKVLGRVTGGVMQVAGGALNHGGKIFGLIGVPTRIAGGVTSGLGKVVSAVSKDPDMVKNLTIDKIKTLLLKGKSLIEKLSDNKVIGKVLSKFSDIVGSKGGQLVKTIIKFLKENVIDKIISKLASQPLKILTKIGSMLGKGIGKAGSAMLTMGVTIGIGGITGAMDAHALFDVDPEDVTNDMRLISALIEALSYTGVGTFVDIVLEVLKLITGLDAKRSLAELLYGAIHLFNKEDMEKLKELQGDLEAEAAVYNALNGTNLSADAYAETKKGKAFDRAINWAKNLGIKGINKVAGVFNGGKEVIATKGKVDTTTPGEALGKLVDSGVTIDQISKMKPSELQSALDSVGYGPGGGVVLGDNKYQQGNRQWAFMPIGVLPNGAIANMANSGCGPTAMAAVYNKVNGLGYGPATPKDMGAYAASRGFISDGGANAGLFTAGAAELGMNAMTLRNPGQLKTNLMMGNPAIITGTSNSGSDPFTSRGHIVVADGYKGGDRTEVLDPITGKKKTYKIDDISKKTEHAWGYSVGHGPGLTIPKNNLNLNITESTVAKIEKKNAKKAANSDGTSNYTAGTSTTRDQNDISKGFMPLEDVPAPSPTKSGLDTSLMMKLARYFLDNDVYYQKNYPVYISTVKKSVSYPGRDGKMVLFSLLGAILSTQYHGSKSGGTGIMRILPGVARTEGRSEGGVLLNLTDEHLQSYIVAATGTENARNGGGGTLVKLSQAEKIVAVLSGIRIEYGFLEALKYACDTKSMKRVIDINDDKYAEMAKANSGLPNEYVTGDSIEGAGTVTWATLHAMEQYQGVLGKLKLVGLVIKAAANASMNGTSFDFELQKLMNEAAGQSGASGSSGGVNGSSGSGGYSGTLNISGDLQKMINNPENIQEELLGKTVELIYRGESGGNYGAVNANDNGSYSVGVYQAHGGKVKTLLDTIAKQPEISSADKETLRKYSAKSDSALSSGEATELSNVLNSATNLPIVKKVSDNIFMSDLNANPYQKRFMGWYDEGFVKDLRSFPLMADIGNTGMAHITGRKNGSSFATVWQPVDKEKELSEVRDLLNSPKLYWATQPKYAKGWANRVNRAYDTLKDYKIKNEIVPGQMTEFFGPGTNPLGYGPNDRRIGESPEDAAARIKRQNITNTAMKTAAAKPMPTEMSEAQRVAFSTSMGKIGSALASHLASKGLSTSSSSGATGATGSISLNNITGAIGPDYGQNIDYSTVGQSVMNGDLLATVSGTDRERFLAAATSQLGYLEKANANDLKGFRSNPGNNSYTKYAQEIGGWNGGNAHWCNFFTSWSAKAAGIPEDIVSRTAACQEFLRKHNQKGEFFSPNTYTPVPGDLMLFDWNNSGTSHHIGIVAGMNGGKVVTVEGNTTGDSQYDQVAEKQRDPKKFVMGYVHPRWTGEKKTVNVPAQLKLGYGPNLKDDSKAKLDSISSREQMRKAIYDSDEFSMSKKDFEAFGFGPGMRVDTGLSFDNMVAIMASIASDLGGLRGEYNKNARAAQSSETVSAKNVNYVSNTNIAAPVTNGSGQTKLIDPSKYHSKLIKQHALIASRDNAKQDIFLGATHKYD